MGDHSFHARLVEMAPGPVHESPVQDCIKIPYADEHTATLAARRFKQRAYRCGCGKWHLTKHARFTTKDRGRRR